MSFQITKVDIINGDKRENILMNVPWGGSICFEDNKTSDGGVLHIANGNAWWSPTQVNIVASFDHLMNMEALLGLSSVFPMLEEMHFLVKFS